MKALRLFALLDHLRAGSGPIPAEMLARALDVSTRTIYRDMASLLAMGAPVRGEAGLGYQLEKGYFLPPLRFDPDEMEAIMLGMRLVAARGDDSLAAAAARATGKIGSSLHGECADVYRNLPLRAVSRKTTLTDDTGQRLPALRRAIRNRDALRLSYLDLRGKASERVVRPLGLTVFDSAWLLTAWCEARDDFRNFRLDRITGVETTGQRFAHQKGKRFQDYLKSL